MCSLDAIRDLPRSPPEQGGTDGSIFLYCSLNSKDLYERLMFPLFKSAIHKTFPCHLYKGFDLCTLVNEKQSQVSFCFIHFGR